MSDLFTYIFRVRYFECDPQGVVFNGRYVEYIDMASTEFIRAIFGSYEELIEQGLDMQVVNLNVSWQSPARADDVLSATVETVKIGNSSVKLRFVISHYGSEELVASAELTYVMVSPDGFKKLTVPEPIKAKLLAGSPNTLVNHAGVEVEK